MLELPLVAPRAFSIGGFFALPAGWRFYWVVQKAECYLDLD
jgi:hypothetical protein